MSDPTDIVLLHSNPGSELFSLFFVNVFIIAPVIGALIAFVTAPMSRPAYVEVPYGEVQKKQPAWGLIILGVAVLAIIFLWYASSRPVPSEPITNTPVSSNTPSSTISPASQWLTLSNKEVSLVYPETWKLILNESDGVVFGDDDFFIIFNWFDEESSTTIHFDAEGKSKEISDEVRKAIEHDAETILQGQEGKIIESRFFERATIGDFKLIGGTGFEAKAEGIEIFAETVSVFTFLPYFACGEYRRCSLIYAKPGDVPMSTNEWQSVEKLMKSVEFSNN